jgi:hypothetical protein
MNESIGGRRGFQSPKKKLSFRNKESSIENVRRDLKDAKDISARNLIAKLDIEEQETNDSDSTIEEVVVIEEETEELEDEEIEYIDTSDDDSYLEALPPPIEIPAALQVKDDDYEEVTTDGSDDESDDEGPEEEKKAPPAKMKPSPIAETKVAPEPIAAEPSVVPSPTKVEPRIETNEESDAEEQEDEVQEMTGSMPGPAVSSVRPMATRGMSYLDEGISAPLSTPTPSFTDEHKTAQSANQEADGSIAWQKPDWTKNSKLRPTGKSTKENLAKPITELPHLKHFDEGGSTAGTVSDPSTPQASKQKVKPVPKTPTPSSNTTSTQARQECPKSAPSRPNAPVLMGNDDLPKIEWTKPDWTRKKILRDTSKGQKLMSGQEISRPIGGIRPVQD